jgi:hypothetical protein
MFKLYRQAEVDESELDSSNPSATSNSERREEASPTSHEPSQSNDADVQQAPNEQPAVSPQPETNTQLDASQEQAVGTQPETATKRGPGRPLLEESAKLKEERKAAQEAKRAANPPSRTSERVHGQQSTRIPNDPSWRGGKIWCPRSPLPAQVFLNKIYLIILL